MCTYYILHKEKNSLCIFSNLISTFSCFKNETLIRGLFVCCGLIYLAGTICKSGTSVFGLSRLYFPPVYSCLGDQGSRVFNAIRVNADHVR